MMETGGCCGIAARTGDKNRPKQPASSVAWQECKSAVISYICVTPPRRAGERRLVGGKVCRGPRRRARWSLGRRVQAEARRRGLGEAPQVFVVADGGVWIWNIVADRFAAATACWIFTTPASTCGTWRTRSIQIMKPGHGRGWSRCCISCGTAAKPGCCKPCRTCRRGACNAHRPCPRPWRAKSITSRNIGASPLCGARGGRLSHRQRRDGILVRATPRPVQTGRPVLDGTRRRRLMALEVARRNQDWNEVWQSN